jgi:site-specific DNA-methyltransferase (adenine-specific)
MEYLINTYTNEGDLILDNCAGSGSTLLAAKNLNRQFIGIEKEKEYYDICLERLK